jgi:hypothetical protein
MTNTVAEYWEWTPTLPSGSLGSAVSLQQPWLGIGTVGGSRFGLPTLRGQDYEIPFRAGMSWRAKYPNSRNITLVMWTAGVDQTATDIYTSADPITAWNNNWQSIRQMFWCRTPMGSAQGRLGRRWHVSYQGAGASTKLAYAMAEVAGSLDPTMTGRTRSDFSADLLLSDPYFYDSTPQSQTCTYNTPKSITGYGEGIVGEGFPSAVNAFTVTLNGPLTVPTLTNSTLGVALTYNGTIASGHSVTFDVLRFTAVTDTGANVVSSVVHSGARMWMAVGNGANSLLLSSTNGSDTGNAVLAFNDCYV